VKRGAFAAGGLLSTLSALWLAVLILTAVDLNPWFVYGYFGVSAVTVLGMWGFRQAVAVQLRIIFISFAGLLVLSLLAFVRFPASDLYARVLASAMLALAIGMLAWTGRRLRRG
jgi:hypothetical protein